MRWAAGGREWKCRPQPQGEHSQIFPALYLENYYGIFLWSSYIFLFCFVLVLYMFSMAQVLLVQQPDTISPAQDHPVTGLAALRLLESLKKYDICSCGSGEPGLGLLPVGFEEETSPSRWCLWWLNCMLAFGLRGNRQSLHDVSAVAADLYQQPLLFTSCGGSPDVHICTWCSSDFGWVKKSRKGFNLSTCGH